MSRPETKGKRRGFVAKVHARPARRFVDATLKKIEQISYDWDEVDSSVARGCDELRTALEEFERGLNESIALMSEPADQD